MNFHSFDHSDSIKKTRPPLVFALLYVEDILSNQNILFFKVQFFASTGAECGLSFGIFFFAKVNTNRENTK